MKVHEQFPTYSYTRYSLGCALSVNVTNEIALPSTVLVSNITIGKGNVGAVNTFITGHARPASGSIRAYFDFHGNNVTWKPQTVASTHSRLHRNWPETASAMQTVMQIAPVNL
jgi:hypothetical protein